MTLSRKEMPIITPKGEPVMSDVITCHCGCNVFLVARIRGRDHDHLLCSKCGIAYCDANETACREDYQEEKTSANHATNGPKGSEENPSPDQGTRAAGLSPEKGCCPDGAHP